MKNILVFWIKGMVRATVWKQTANKICKHQLREPLIVSTIAFFATVRDAHAYIDPGSGALIWQMLFAAFVGALFFARNISRWVMTWLHALKRKAKEKRQ